MNYKCDNCNEVVELQKLRRKVLKGLVYEFYHHCPNCDYKHISYYTDKKIRKEIKRQEKRWERYRKMGTEESERKLLAQIKMNDKLIKKDMDALYEKMQKEVV